MGVWKADVSSDSNKLCGCQHFHNDHRYFHLRILEVRDENFWIYLLATSAIRNSYWKKDLMKG